MKGPSIFCDIPNGRVYKLTRRVVAADSECLKVRAFSRYVCARVWYVAKLALISRSVSVTLSEFAIMHLTVSKFEKG